MLEHRDFKGFEIDSKRVLKNIVFVRKPGMTQYVTKTMDYDKKVFLIFDNYLAQLLLQTFF